MHTQQKGWHMDKRYLGILFFISFSLFAMDKPNPEEAHKKTSDNSYLGVLKTGSADVLKEMLPTYLVSHNTQVRDNRGDQLIDSARTLARFKQIIQSEYKVNVSKGDATCIDRLLNQLKSLPPGKSFKSFCLPNRACITALINPILLREEYYDKKRRAMRIEEFRALSQEQKNESALQVMRLCPSKTVISGLLEGGAQVNSVDKDSQFSLLRLAVEAEIPPIRKKRLISYLVKNPLLDLNKDDRHNVTPFMRAVSQEDVQTAQLLCNAGASVNPPDRLYNTSLAIAAFRGNQVLVQMILAKKASIYACEPQKQDNNPLAMAVKGNSPHAIDVLKMLFAARNPDGDANRISEFKYFADTALYEAAQIGRLDIAQFLMGMPDIAIRVTPKSRLLDPDRLIDNHSAITISIIKGHYPLTCSMLEYVKYERNKVTMRQVSRSDALSHAVRKRCASENEVAKQQLDEVIEKILEYEHSAPEHSQYSKDNPPIDNLSADSICLDASYQAAAGNDQRQLRRLLWEAREVDPLIGHRAFMQAAVLNNATALKVLLPFVDKDGCDMNGDSALHKIIPACDQSLSCVNALLAAQANIFKLNNRRESVFHKIFVNKDPVVRMKLLEAFHDYIGSDETCNALVNARNSEGVTPILIGAERPNNAAVMQKLIEMGANVNDTTKNGDTPLILSAARIDDQAVEVLLRAKANPNAANNSGCTALTKVAAAQEADEGQMARGKKIVKLIIESGGDFPASREPMLRTAAKNGNVTLVQDFLECQANVNAGSSSYNNTALHKASEKGHLEVVETLLDHPETNVQAVNIHGKKAIELATASDDASYELVQALLFYKNKKR